MVLPSFCSRESLPFSGLKAQIVSNDLGLNLGSVSAQLGGLPSLCLSLSFVIWTSNRLLCGLNKSTNPCNVLRTMFGNNKSEVVYTRE